MHINIVCLWIRFWYDWKCPQMVLFFQIKIHKPPIGIELIKGYRVSDPRHCWLAYNFSYFGIIQERVILIIWREDDVSLASSYFP